MSEQEIPVTIKPSRAWYILAMVLMIGAPLCAIYIMVTTIVGIPKHLYELSAGGATSITISTPGTYTVWQSTTVGNYTDIQSVTVSNQQTGENLNTTQWKNLPEKDGTIGEIKFEKPGTYNISITGADTNEKVELRFPNFSDQIKNIFKALFLFVFGIVGGAILAISLFVTRSRNKAKLRREGVLGPLDDTELLEEPATEEDHNARVWAAFCHLGAFCGFIVPFTNILVPLILWLSVKDKYALVKDQGRESLNFQISITLYAALCILLVLLFIGIILLPLLTLFAIIAVIYGSIAASQGKHFRYPLCIRFIR